MAGLVDVKSNPANFQRRKEMSKEEKNKKDENEPEIAVFECTRMCWFDLKLWQKGEILKVREEDVMGIITRHFKRVDGKKDPRTFERKTGRPLWLESVVVQEKKEEKEETPGDKEEKKSEARELKKAAVPFSELTRAQLMVELDKKDVPYDQGAKKEDLRQLLADIARMENTETKDV